MNEWINGINKRVPNAKEQIKLMNKKLMTRVAYSSSEKTFYILNDKF